MKKQLLAATAAALQAGAVARPALAQHLAIVNGTHEAPIARAIASDTGTLFLPAQGKRRRDAARKAWLGGRMKLKGALVVDMGAARALQGGSSLLAAGVTSVTGTFARGDPVGIVDADGTVLAHGLSEYDSVECDRLKGRQSSEHEALLGYAPRSAVVHRNQLVLK